MLLLPLLVVPLAIVLVAVSVVGLAGVGPLSDERRAGRTGSLATFGAATGLLAGAAVLVLGVVVVVVLGGLDPGTGDDNATRGASRTRGGSRPASTPSVTTPAGTAITPPGSPPPGTTPPGSPPTRSAGAPGSVGALGPVVRIDAESGEMFPESYDVAGGLAPETVLQVRVRGFEPFSRAVAEQCAPGRNRRCANRIRVQVDADGEAQFQYLVTDAFLAPDRIPGGCRAGASACRVVVRGVDGGARGEIQTVFVDAVPPPGIIEVTPSRDLSLAGQVVTVVVHDYPAGSRVEAMVCAAPDAIGRRCGRPGPIAPLVVGPNGTGRTTMRIEPGFVGADRVRCERGDDCGISVVSDAVFARAPVVPISFAAPPGATYDSNRLLAGVGVALILVMIAAWLLRRTDWSAVGEAAAPEIDDAEYADLDAIIAALPPDPDDPPPGSPGGLPAGSSHR